MFDGYNTDDFVGYAENNRISTIVDGSCYSNFFTSSCDYSLLWSGVFFCCWVLAVNRIYILTIASIWIIKQWA